MSDTALDGLRTQLLDLTASPTERSYLNAVWPSIERYSNRVFDAAWRAGLIHGQRGGCEHDPVPAHDGIFEGADAAYDAMRDEQDGVTP